MKIVKPRPISAQAVKHHNYLAKMIEKHPDRINVANVLVGVRNLGYLDIPCRQILVDFTNHILKTSSQADGITQPLFGSPDRGPKVKVIYKEKIVKVPVEKVVEKIIYRTPDSYTLPLRIPVLTDVVQAGRATTPSLPPDQNDHSREGISVPPKAIPTPKTDRRSSSEVRATKAELCARQMHNSTWWTDGVKALRLPEGTQPPPGFKRGMLKRKLSKMTADANQNIAPD